MATARRHTTPPPTGVPPRRQAFDDLSLSINDIVPVANATDRAQLVAALTAAGSGPSPARPLYVHRQDADPGRELERTTDGTTWAAIPTDQQGTGAAVTTGPGWSVATGAQNAVRVVRSGRRRTLYGAVVAGSGFATSTILTVAADDRPPTGGTRGVGVAVTSGGGVYGLFLTAGVLGFVTGYGSGASVAIGQVIQLAGLSWWMD